MRLLTEQPLLELPGTQELEFMKQRSMIFHWTVRMLPLALAALTVGCSVRITSMDLPPEVLAKLDSSGNLPISVESPTPTTSPSPTPSPTPSPSPEPSPSPSPSPSPVPPANHAPTVSAATPYFVLNSSTITVTMNDGAGPAFTASDIDAGDTLTLSSVTGAQYGTVSRTATSFTYTPNAGGRGRETLTLTVTDSQGAQGTGTIQINVMTAKTWTGATSNTWDSTTGANWCGTVKADFTGCNGGSVPGASDVAVIDDTCSGANCSPTTNYNVSLTSLAIAGSTLTMGATRTLTLTGTLTQSAGTFNGADGAILVNGAVTISGGTFKSTSGTLTVRDAWTISGSPSFDHNNGTLQFQASWAQSRTITPSTVSYKNVNFVGAEQTFTVSGTMAVAGNFAISSSWAGIGLDTGTINVSGNIANSGSYGVGGNGTIVAAGSGTISGVSSSSFPNITINTSGTYSLAGTVKINGNYTYTAGTLNTAGASIIFGAPWASTRTITPGNLTYSNVTFAGSASTYNLGGATLNVQDLTLADAGGSSIGSLNNGTVKVYGNLTASGIGLIGSASIEMVGTGTITGSSGAPLGKLVINTSDTISLSGTIVINGSYTWQAGAINAGTSTLKFATTTGSSQSLTLGPASYATIDFSGYIATQNLGGATVNVQNLILSDVNSSGSGAVNNGTILVSGNLTASSYGKAGTVAIQLTGGSAASINQASANSWIPASLSINKTAGTMVSLSSAVTLNRAGQTLNLTSGGLDLAGNALSITGTLSLNGNTLTKTGGTLTVNGTAQGTGSLFGGTVDP